MSEPLPNTDPAAERMILGAIVLGNGRVLSQLADLNFGSEDFALEQHRQMYLGILTYLDTGRTIGPELFQSWLVARKETALATYLPQCTSAVTVVADAVWHARNLQVLTARRRIALASARLASVATTAGDFDVDELYEIARGQVDEQTRTADRVGTYGVVSDLMVQRLGEWDIPDTEFISTGWPDLDRMLNGGLRPGNLCIIGARPSIGKSMFVTQLAGQCADRAVSTYFASLEMTRWEVTDRLASNVSGVPLTTLTTRTATPDDKQRLLKALDRIDHWPLVVDDRASVGVSAIRGRARDLTRTPRGLGLIVIDYLQLMTPSDRTASREQQVASFSRGLKLLAKDLEVPVVAVAQVGRSAAGTRPALHDLRESGAIEADADQVIFLHRDPNQDDTEDRTIEVGIAKNRHGACGHLDLSWQPTKGRIASIHRA